MITGYLSDVSKQKTLLPAAVVRALEILQQQDLASLAVGRYEIDGDKLFYMVQETILRPLEASRSEAHRKYADIQIPLNTRERYGVSLPQPSLTTTEDHLESRDVAYYIAPANEYFMDLDPGSYAVFLPEELHRPCMTCGEVGALRKVVVKIHHSLLGL
ncbi:MAG: YhcH/YjgK/YiaL family protein [Formivibrio sp.]|nr:YhcH/YjgK/YiaL family protein [Formivibrio sp.]